MRRGCEAFDFNAATVGQNMGSTLAKSAGIERQVQSNRREFLSQAAAIAFATSCPLCCGCPAKNSSDVDDDKTRGMSQQPTTFDQASSSKSRSADIEQRVAQIVAEQMRIPREKVQRESRFKEDLGADSLDTVELVMEFEEEFGISIPDDLAVKTFTVGQTIDLVAKLLGDRPVPPRKVRRTAPSRK